MFTPYRKLTPAMSCMLCYVQVIALAAAPFLLDHPKSKEIFLPDAIARARVLVKAFNGGVGAYQVRTSGGACTRKSGMLAAVAVVLIALDHAVGTKLAQSRRDRA